LVKSRGFGIGNGSEYQTEMNPRKINACIKKIENKKRMGKA
jgi:hypothetical protein